MANSDPETGLKPASRVNPLLYGFVGVCEPCDAVWICGNLLSHQHALIAMRLPWLCPECSRPLAIKAYPKHDQPEGSA